MEPQFLIYESNGIRIDTAAFRVERGGVPCELEPKAFDLLIYLVRHAGRVVTKVQIFDEVWGGIAVSDNALTRVVAQLRRELGDTAREPRLIETVPTRGYRWLPPVVEVPATSPASVAPSAAPEPSLGQPSPPSPSRARSVRPVLVLAAVVLAVGAVAATRWWGRRPVAATPKQPPSAQLASGFPVQITTRRGLDIFPTASPDGKAVIYASDRSGRFELYLRPLVSGGAETQLTSDGMQNVEPAWSPDGEHVAFHSLLRDGVWVMPALGGAPRQIASFGSAPAWSPDGRMVAFQSDPLTDLGPAAFGARPGSTIWVVPADGSAAPRALTTRNRPAGGHASPVWVPGGSGVMFLNQAIASTEFWLVGADGTGLTRLLALNGSAYDPAFAPDGRRLFTAAGAAVLWMMAFDPQAPNVPKEGTAIGMAGVDGLRFPAPTSDGRVLFSGITLESQLLALPLDRRTGEPAGPTRALTNSSARRTSAPMVSPDGDWVAYVSGARGAAADIWVTRVDGSDTQQVTTSPEPDMRPTWFRDSDALSFISSRNGVRGVWQTSRTSRHESLLLRWPAESADRREALRHLSQDARMSPDGTRVAFSAVDPRTGREELHVRVIATGEDRVVVSDEDGANYPCWSPDGSTLAFEAKRNGSSEIAVVSSAGSRVRLLTAAPGQHWVHSFSPDGSRVLSADLENGVWNIASTSIADGRRRVMTSYTAPGTFVRYPAWSPRGDLIVFEEARLRGNLWVADLAQPQVR